MLTLLYFFISLIASVGVVKTVATLVKAGRHDWLTSVIAVVLSIVVLTTVSNLVSGQLSVVWQFYLATLMLSIVVVGFVLESVLDTSLVKGMSIAAAAIVVQWVMKFIFIQLGINTCLLYTSPSPRDLSTSRMPSSA